ncbi:MAG: ATP-dependent Clp protease proteolytic subunit, partial [Candidatus Poribacteria bacterium]|nr:ATP-dependent Clp protease proteolytic subunit [Candidatus Poribacteria bacterium]
SLKKRLNEIYSKHTEKSVDEIKSALERDNFMTPENAKDFGLIDKVVNTVRYIGLHIWGDL